MFATERRDKKWDKQRESWTDRQRESGTNRQREGWTDRQREIRTDREGKSQAKYTCSKRRQITDRAWSDALMDTQIEFYRLQICKR